MKPQNTGKRNGKKSTHQQDSFMELETQRNRRRQRRIQKERDRDRRDW